MDINSSCSSKLNLADIHLQIVIFDEKVWGIFLKFLKYQVSLLDTRDLFVEVPTEHNCSKLEPPRFNE